MNTLSNYIVDREPHRFGGKQEDYVKRRDEAITVGVGMIRDAVENKRDLKQLFFQIQELFGKVRHDIAVAHRTEDANSFGRKRLEHTLTNFLFTPLGGGCYLEYNQKFILFLQKALKNKIPIQGPLPQSIAPIEDVCLGRKCSFEFELIEMSDFIKSADEASELRSVVSKYPGVLKTEKVDEIGYPPTAEEQIVIDAVKKHFKEMKINKPNDYKQIMFRGAFKYLQFDFLHQYSPLMNASAYSTLLHTLVPNIPIIPQPRAIFIRGVAQLEINGRMIPLTEYITWTYQDQKSDPVLHLTNSTVTIVHLDQFLINEVLQDCAAVFEQAILWQKPLEEFKELTDRTSLMHYLQSEATEDLRGSAAKAEWTELLLYNYHAKDVQLNPQKMGDLEALTAPLWSTFHNNYLSTLLVTD